MVPEMMSQTCRALLKMSHSGSRQSLIKDGVSLDLLTSPRLSICRLLTSKVQSWILVLSILQLNVYMCCMIEPNSVYLKLDQLTGMH